MFNSCSRLPITCNHKLLLHNNHNHYATLPIAQHYLLRNTTYYATLPITQHYLLRNTTYYETLPITQHYLLRNTTYYISHTPLPHPTPPHRDINPDVVIEAHNYNITLMQHFDHFVNCIQLVHPLAFIIIIFIVFIIFYFN